MYKVLCDGYELLNLNTEELVLNSPVLHLKDNESGSLTFSISPHHPYISKIHELSSEVVVECDGEEIWSGRVIDAPEEMWKQKNVRCEGELSYLVDTTQPMAEYHGVTVRGFLESLLNIHNSKAGADKQFQIGIVTVQGHNDSILRYTNRETTLECIKDKLVDRFGGHLRIRKENGVRYLDYLQDSPRTSQQVIQFGENLLDYAKNFDVTDLTTVVIPLGAELETTDIEALRAYTTIESVNGGKDYIKSNSAVSSYGWIEKVVHFDDITVPANLLTKGQQYLADAQYASMILEVSAVDLHNVDVTYDTIRLLDTIRVVSSPHGMDRNFPVSEMTINLTNASKNKLVLGTKVKTSMTGVTKSANTDLINRIQSIPPVSSILESAKDNASQLIRNALNGHVVITDDASELLIMDTDDIQTATKVWRFNLNGLGYSSTGYNGTFGLALTMDGKIVADYITAGTLNADVIKAGILSDRAGKNFWNLVTGSLVTEDATMKNVVIDNGVITTRGTGSISGQTHNKELIVGSGIMEGYDNDALTGLLDLCATYRTGKHVALRSEGVLHLQSGDPNNGGTEVTIDSNGLDAGGTSGTFSNSYISITVAKGVVTSVSISPINIPTVPTLPSGVSGTLVLDGYEITLDDGIITDVQEQQQ